MTILLLFFTFIVSSLLFVAIFSSAKEKTPPYLKIFSFGMGPISISWLLKIFLTIFPNKSDLFYINVILICFFLPLLYLVYIRQAALSFTFNTLNLKEKITFKNIFVSIFVLIIFIACFVLPLEENDALEYALVAKIIYRDKTLALYPFFNADAQTGFQSSSSHPLGYINLIVWDYIIQASSKAVILMRFINPYYATLLLLLLKESSSKKSPHLFLLTISFLWIICTQYQIDIMRIFFFTLSLFLLPKNVSNMSYQQTAIIILSVCGALYSHSIGILIIFFLPLTIIFHNRISFQSLLAIIKIILPAMLIAGDRYISNFFNFGFPISDSNIIWGLPHINEATDLVYRRNIFDFPRKLILGLFQGFFKIHLFGPVFSLAVISSFTMFRAKNIPQNYKTSALIFYTFQCFALFSIILGSSLIIKNPRYFLSIAPFAAYMSSYVEFFYHKRLFNRIIQISIILFSLISIYRPLTSIISIKKFTSPTDEFKRLSLSKDPAIPVLESLKSIKTSKKFLIFEQNQFSYYIDKSYIRDLDSRLVDFYKLINLRDAFNFLTKENIYYIYHTPYIPATFYNSLAMQLAGDPRFSELLLDENGYRLFQLKMRSFKNDMSIYPEYISSKESCFLGNSFPILVKTNFIKEKSFTFHFSIKNYYKAAKITISLKGKGMISLSKGKLSKNLLRAVLENQPKNLVFQIKPGNNHLEIISTISPNSEIIIEKCVLEVYS